MFTILVSLYTSRVVLQILGVEDFGIYTIVGGVVTLFSFLNGAMTTSTQRFLSFALGKKDLAEMKRVFSMSMTAHISIALIIILLAETVGLWFFNAKMNIPEGRLFAANWVYQFSLMTFCVKIIRIPYQSSVVTYEKFSFYAYIGIVEVVLNLLVVFLLLSFNSDQLIIYGALLFVVSIIVNIAYWTYCRWKYDTCRCHFVWDKKLYVELMSFSGWSVFGSFANISAQQGLNILLNLFYGVVVNAAMGIANQLTTAVNSFVSNFQLAYNPQIVKSYAANDKSYFMNLIFQTSKYSYFLLFIISLPFLMDMDFVLQVWLGNVPEYAGIFCRLMLVFCLTDAISAPLWMAVQAIGKIRNYQVFISFLIFLSLPLSFVALKLGFPAEAVFYIRIVINLIAFCFRIGYLHVKAQLPSWRYIKEVVLVTLFVSIVSVIVPILVQHHLKNTWIGFIQMALICIIITGVVIYFIGLSHKERQFLKRAILNRVKE